jgi:hypothetical protein
LSNNTQKLTEIEKTNIDYENKLALITQEVERLSLLNKNKSEERNKLVMENEELKKLVEELKIDVERIGFNKKMENS